MKEYDVIVVGSGSGMLIVEEALSDGLKVALVDKGPYGGTCLILGCIPSKTLIYPADVIAQIQESKKLGIDAEIRSVDFASIMERMRGNRRETQEQIRHGVEHVENQLLEVLGRALVAPDGIEQLPSLLVDKYGAVDSGDVPSVERLGDQLRAA